MNNKKITKVIIDRNLCIGAATCAAICPKAFKMDKNNKATLLKSWTKAEEKILLDAARSCPVDAITLIDNKSKTIWPKSS